MRYGLKCELVPRQSDWRRPAQRLRRRVRANRSCPRILFTATAGLWTGEVTKLAAGGRRFPLRRQLHPDAAAPRAPISCRCSRDGCMPRPRSIPNRLVFYVDEQVTPGDRHQSRGLRHLLVGGPRLVRQGGTDVPAVSASGCEDQTAFVYDVSSITMYSPDNGLEFGWLRGHWDTQVAVSEGTAAGGFALDPRQGIRPAGELRRGGRGGSASPPMTTTRRSRGGGSSAFSAACAPVPVDWLGRGRQCRERSRASPACGEAAGLLEARLAHRGRKQSQGHAGALRSRSGRYTTTGRRGRASCMS